MLKFLRGNISPPYFTNPSSKTDRFIDFALKGLQKHLHIPPCSSGFVAIKSILIFTVFSKKCDLGSSLPMTRFFKKIGCVVKIGYLGYYIRDFLWPAVSRPAGRFFQNCSLTFVVLCWRMRYVERNHISSQKRRRPNGLAEKRLKKTGLFLLWLGRRRYWDEAWFLPREFI